MARPGLKIPAGSNACLSCAWMRCMAASCGSKMASALIWPALSALKSEALPPTCCASALRVAPMLRGACTQRKPPCHSTKGAATPAGSAKAGAVCGTDKRHRQSVAARALNQGSVCSRHAIQFGAACAASMRVPPMLWHAASTAATAPRSRTYSVPTPLSSTQQLAFSGKGWPPHWFRRCSASAWLMPSKRSVASPVPPAAL